MHIVPPVDILINFFCRGKVALLIWGRIPAGRLQPEPDGKELRPFAFASLFSISALLTIKSTCMFLDDKLSFLKTLSYSKDFCPRYKDDLGEVFLNEV